MSQQLTPEASSDCFEPPLLSLAARGSLTTCVRADGHAWFNYTFLTSYERDGETDLNFAQARYHSSAQGRFAQADPFLGSSDEVQPQSWNRYSYVINNPMRYTDPLGLYFVGGGTAETNQDPNDPRNGDPKSLLIPARDLQIIIININLDLDSGKYMSDGQAAAKSLRQLGGLSSLSDEFGSEPSGDDRAVSGTLSIGSAAASANEYYTYRPGKYWRGINGIRYTNMTGRGPNQYTGPRSLAIQKAGAWRVFGRALGVAGMTISIGQGYEAYNRGDTAGVVKSGFDTGFGAAGSFGGPYGAGAAAVYFGIDLTIGWSEFNRGSTEGMRACDRACRRK